MWTVSRGIIPIRFYASSDGTQTLALVTKMETKLFFETVTFLRVILAKDSFMKEAAYWNNRPCNYYAYISGRSRNCQEAPLYD
jgi:hypothetical protein